MDRFTPMLVLLLAVPSTSVCDQADSCGGCVESNCVISGADCVDAGSSPCTAPPPCTQADSCAGCTTVPGDPALDASACTWYNGECTFERMAPPWGYPPCAYSASGSGDPHMLDGQGGYFDFKGKQMTVYNLLSTANFSVNAFFKHTDYTDAGPKKRLIHGSFMTAAYVTTKASDGRIVQIEYDATRAVLLPIKIDGAAPTVYRAPASMSVANVDISLKDRKMTITTSEWAVTASSTMKKGILRGNSCATGKCFLNVAVKPVTDVHHATVAPHGLLGQAFDGGDISFIGATDKYTGNEFTTSAMGEGAIEGTAKDYEMADKFSTEFKFSRWGMQVAKPRDVSTLTGMKFKRAQASKGMWAASAEDNVGLEESGVTE